MVLTLEVKADGWDADTSTPVIAHIEDADGKVDFYTAIAANKQVTVKVGKSGTCLLYTSSVRRISRREMELSISLMTNTIRLSGTLR